MGNVANRGAIGPIYNIKHPTEFKHTYFINHSRFLRKFEWFPRPDIDPEYIGFVGSKIIIFNNYKVIDKPHKVEDITIKINFIYLQILTKNDIFMFLILIDFRKIIISKVLFNGFSNRILKFFPFLQTISWYVNRF